MAVFNHTKCMEILSSTLHKVPMGGWAIYAVIMEPEPGDFLIKIGVSGDPLQRLTTFSCGLPFSPAMLISPRLDESRAAFHLENRLHKAFSEYRTRGEWHRFSSEDKVAFHATTKLIWESYSNRPLEWKFLDRDACEKGIKMVIGLNSPKKKRRL